MIREIVTIDEELCDGCGLCIPSCAEGALRLVNGKAKLVSDRLCDGLGACLGHCPRGAIRVERREAAEFDEDAVAAAGHHEDTKKTKHEGTKAQGRAGTEMSQDVHAGGCPGSRIMQFGRPAAPAACPTGAPGAGERAGGLAVGEAPDGSVDGPGASSASPAQSELTHWPVQLHLVPPHHPALKGARLLVAADCVPFAYAGFHQDLLRGRAVVVGCPKLDDLQAYLAKLTEMFRVAGLREVVVARMEVPCCGGIVAAVLEARRRAGAATPVTEVVISTRGDVLARRELPVGAAA